MIRIKLDGITGTVRRAVSRYGMIEKGDRIAVAVSGGKDSMVMLRALLKMASFEDFSYGITAYTVDCTDRAADYYGEISGYISSLGVTHRIIRTDIYQIVFGIRKEESPCSLCSRMRRAALVSAAEEDGCNVIALGHTLDDVAETYMMNITRNGKASCFSPVTYYGDRGIRLIRPMIYADEREISGCVRSEGIPVTGKICPADGNTGRESTKQFLEELRRGEKHLYERILHAVESSGADGWHL